LDEFVAAVDAMSLEWSAGAREAAAQSLRRHGLCLLGEIRDAYPNPA
jgi:hypothetical protein